MRVQSVMPGLKEGNSLGKLKKPRYTQYRLIRTTATVVEPLFIVGDDHGTLNTIIRTFYSMYCSWRCC